jgi:cytochrome c oxidase assembly protein subunit 15
MHFVLALVLLCYTYWFALKFLVKRESIVIHKGLKTYTWILVALLFVQLFYGALMADIRQLLMHLRGPHQWQMVPEAMNAKMPDSIAEADTKNFTERKAIITTHFIHRTLAYTLVLLVLLWTIKAARIQGTELSGK